MLPWQDKQGLGGPRGSSSGGRTAKLYQSQCCMQGVDALALSQLGRSRDWGLTLQGWDPTGEAVLTEVLQDPVPLQLCVPNLVLQQDQLLLVLVLQGLQAPLAVLQLINQLLLDLYLASQIRQVGLEIHGWRPVGDSQAGRDEGAWLPQPH